MRGLVSQFVLFSFFFFWNLFDVLILSNLIWEYLGELVLSLSLNPLFFCCWGISSFWLCESHALAKGCKIETGLCGGERKGRGKHLHLLLLQHVQHVESSSLCPFPIRNAGNILFNFFFLLKDFCLKENFGFVFLRFIRPLWALEQFWEMIVRFKQIHERRQLF